MNLLYKEFMDTESHKGPFDNLEGVAHGNNKELFREAYEAYYLEEDVEIYRCDDPVRLCFGFVIIDGNIREWHSVHISAWSSHDNFLKDMEK